jgi:hypothetical protein
MKDLKFAILWVEGSVIGPILILIARVVGGLISILHYTILCVLVATIYTDLSDFRHFIPCCKLLFLIGIITLTTYLGWIITYVFLRIFMKDAKKRLTEFKKDTKWQPNIN